MDLCGPTPIAEPFESPHQIVHRVPMLTEDEPLLVLVLGLLHDLSQALELRLPPGVEQPARPLRQRLHLPGLMPQLLHADHSDRAEHRILVGLVSLRPTVRRHVLVRGPVVEVVAPVALAQQRLPAVQQLRGEFAGLDRVRGLSQLLDPPLEGAQQSPRRAGQASLKHGLGEFHRRLIVQSAAVMLVQVLRRAVVEILLAVVPSTQLVRERAASARRVERLTVEADHFLLRAAEEVPVAGGVGGRGVRLPLPRRRRHRAVARAMHRGGSCPCGA